MERQERLTRPGTLPTFQTCWTFPTFLNVCPDCQRQILADVPGKPSLFKIEVVTFSPLCRFSEFFRAGYIANVRYLFFRFFWPIHFWSWSVNNIKIAFLLPVLSLKKVFLLCFFVLAVKQPIPIIPKNYASSHQMMMSVRVVFALVGTVIYSYQNLFVNNDCVFVIHFCFWLF